VRGILEQLRERLEHLEPLLGKRRSLDAWRPCAPSPVELALRVTSGSGDVERVRAFAHGLEEVIRAIADDFPDNVFWDLDYLASCLWQAGEAREMGDYARRVVGLCREFGNKSVLRFRYAHDFLYGYDWARWVAREPRERAELGPFHPRFFDYLESRCQKLRELIAQDDAKYGQLRGQEFRNPFTFSREPHEEERLHQVLARADHIPVKAWRLDGERRWNLPFADLRVAEACRLGISRGASR
jgi:hypothetical protein